MRPSRGALAFMLSVRERIMATAALLERRLPALAEGDGVRLLMRLHAPVIGLQHSPTRRTEAASGTR